MSIFFTFLILHLHKCRCGSGEIGRRTILRGWRLHWCTGSSPVFRTLLEAIALSNGFFCFKAIVQLYMTLRNRFVCLFLGCLLVSCNEGLEPAFVSSTQQTGSAYIKGTLIIKNGISGWNDSKDSVYAVRVAAFVDNPPSNIVQSLLSGTAYLSSDSIELFTDSSTFIVEIPDPPKTIRYLGAALQYKKNDIFAQRVIGLYTPSGDVNLPGIVELKPRDTAIVRIMIDFANLPPQPQL